MKRKIFVCALVFAFMIAGTSFAEIISVSGVAVVSYPVKEQLLKAG